jgi:hypothetical protein
MIVKLRRKNAKYPDLTVRQPYVVIGIESDDYRILNDAGRPYLYFTFAACSRSSMLGNPRIG